MTQQLHKIEGVNGTDLLFQIPTPFITGTLVVLLISPPANNVALVIEEMGTSYFKLPIAPTAGDDLYCYYDQADEALIGIDTLSPWEKKSITGIMSILSHHTQTLTNLRASLDNAVTFHDFSTYTEIIEKDLADIKTSLL